jgi:cytoskeletal protein RodZ
MEQENSSRYVNQPTEPSRGYEPQPRKKSKAPVVLGTLLLLALIAAGVLGWLWQQESSKASAAQAGLESVEKKLQDVTAENNKLSETKKEEVTESKKTDNDAIVSSLAAYARGKSKDTSTKISVSVKKLQQPFAAATFSDETAMVGPMGLCILKKSDDIWMVLYCTAQNDNEYLQMLDRQFSVPASIKQ